MAIRPECPANVDDVLIARTQEFEQKNKVALIEENFQRQLTNTFFINQKICLAISEIRRDGGHVDA
jgi:hypothetical protein